MTVTEGGRVIAGRYRLMAPLGSGGVGIVWRARDELLDREVAVKEIARLAVADERERAETYERTLREARAAARISHPGVAAVYDVVSEDGRPYIVMELIGGHPLSQLIADEGALPEAQVADIGRQVLAALRAGHAAGVLHRDLKPGNVLITPAGRAVLTDFGIASVIGDPSITRTGVVVGTPGYLAPERIKGEAATPAADLWSLGATLYAAASGHGPYDGYDGPIATMFVIATEEPPALTAGGPLRDVIGALLSRDPRLRPSPAEAARALDAAADSLARAEPAASAGPLPAPTEVSAGRDAWEPGQSPQEPAQPPQYQDPPRTVTSGLPQIRPVTAPVTGEDFAVPGREEAGWTHPPGKSWGADNDLDDLFGDVGTAPPPRRSGPRRPRGRPGRRAGAVAAVAAGVVAVVAVAVTLSLSKGPAPRAGNAADIQTGSQLQPVAQQFRVAAVEGAQGTTELFGQAPDGSLRHLTVAGGPSSDWTTLPGGPRYAGVPAVVTGKNGQLVVLARTTDGKLAELWQTAPGSGSWDGPRTLGSQRIGSDPSVIAWPDGHLEAFARLSDGSLGDLRETGDAAGGGTWSSWASLGGSLGSPPAAAMDAAGQPQVFAVASDSSLVYWHDRNGRWAGPVMLPGGRGYAGTPAVGRDADGRTEAFARTSSGTIKDVRQLPGAPGRWGGPTSLIGGIASDPAVFNTNEGRLEVFATAANGKTMHTWQILPNGPTGWNQPKSLGGDTVGAPAGIRFSNRSELFARGPDGKLGYSHLDGPVGQWAPWVSLGGSF